MTGSYPFDCPRVTNACTPTVSSISSCGTQLDSAKVGNLSAGAVKSDRAVINYLGLTAASLGIVSGGSTVTADNITVQEETIVNVADFGTAQTPTQTLQQGSALQPNLVTLPTSFVSYAIPSQTPHMAILIATAGAASTNIYLPDTPGLTFPPVGYRLSIFNISAIYTFLVVSPNATVTALTGGPINFNTNVGVASNTAFIFVWSGATWLFSFLI